MDWTDSKSIDYWHTSPLCAMSGTITFLATVLIPLKSKNMAISDHNIHHEFWSSLYPNPNLNKLRIRDQDGLIQIYHLLSILGLKKAESYPPVKAASKQSVKGRRLRIDGIWNTGLGSTSLQCQKTATIFITQLMTRQVKLQNNEQPATGPMA